VNLNSVQLAGNLTRDPELRYTGSGQAVVEASIAINRKWRTDAGEDREEVTFIGLIIWGKSAETFSRMMQKGCGVFIQGRLTQQQWDDKATGQKREKTKVTVDSWQYVSGTRRMDGQRPAQRSEPRPATETSAPASAEFAQKSPSDEGDDSVPF
jgi:single-strand DNA-binding protein